MKNNLAKILKISMVLVLVISMVAGCGKTETRDPKEVVTESYKNTGFMTEGWLSGDYLVKDVEFVGSKDMQVVLVESIVKGMSIKYDFKYSLKDTKTEMKLKVMMDDTNIVDAIIHLNGEYIAVEIPQLYEKMLYMNWKDIPTFMQSMGVPINTQDIDVEAIMKHIADYKDVFDIEGYDSFKAIKEGNLMSAIIDNYYQDIKKDKKGSITIKGLDGKDMKIEGDTYTAKLNFKDTTKKTQEMYKQIFEDENVKQLSMDIINKLVDKVIENKDLVVYNALFNEEEPVQEWSDKETVMLNEVKKAAKTEIDKAFKEVLKSMEEEMTNKEEFKIMDSIYSAMDSNTTMVIKDDKMKAMEMTLKIDLKKEDLDSKLVGNADFEGFKLDMLMSQNYHTGEKVAFEGKKADAINVSELSKEDLFGIYMMVMQNSSQLATQFQTGNMGE